MNTFILISSLLIISFNSYASDTANGKVLHTTNCLAYHTSNIYVSAARKVHGLATLTARAKHCDLSLGTQWLDNDIADVVAYLNKDFYKFR
ncbi:MAG: hypothetical protein A6F72_03205 [Cycloclasticus sp. symbiont of Poecilosclerida sp. N]|nr:MAG: hypothetical protein A6F72_03205 [Cycloclasticus sp. symbiont of Poecilosclerida sp. N]